jgi:DNA-binding IclR family transcriptional regulator
MNVVGTEKQQSGQRIMVQSVLTAIDILDCFATDEELGVSEIGRRLGVSKSTAYRLLVTLCCRGLTEKNHETNQYRLGLYMFELGQIAITRVKLRQAALPLLEELRRRTGSTVQLSTPDGIDVIFLERLQGSRGLGLLMPFGRRTPSHAASGGKAVAAFNPVLAEARHRAGFPKLTPLTTGSSQEFDRHLTATRSRGYASTFDEVAIGLSSVAAPIFDFNGDVHAALSLIDTTDEVRANLGRMALLTIEAARRLSRLSLPD